MVVTFISPRYGQGKTVTLINIAIMILKKTKKDKVLIIDLNSGYSDIDEYLSNSYFTKGLDEFCNLYRLKMLNAISFTSCVKNVFKRLDIMAANTSDDIINTINKSEVLELIRYAENLYEYILIDTGNINSDVTNEFMYNSVLSVCIVQPIKKILDNLIEKLDKLNLKNILYILNMLPDIYDFKIHLKENSFYYKLPFDFDLIKELNDESIINYIMKNRLQNNSYYKNMESIVNKIMAINGVTIVNKKRSILHRNKNFEYQGENIN